MGPAEHTLSPGRVETIAHIGPWICEPHQRIC